jgi:hypothetical protein
MWLTEKITETGEHCAGIDVVNGVGEFNRAVAFSQICTRPAPAYPMAWRSSAV